jgi:hypothetical protein
MVWYLLYHSENSRIHHNILMCPPTSSRGFRDYLKFKLIFDISYLYSKKWSNFVIHWHLPPVKKSKYLQFSNNWLIGAHYSILSKWLGIARNIKNLIKVISKGHISQETIAVPVNVRTFCERMRVQKFLSIYYWITIYLQKKKKYFCRKLFFFIKLHDIQKIRSLMFFLIRFLK